jgi:UDP-glucose 4-epimerase
MNILIPGGAGYIGSHTVKSCQDLGHEVVVLDNFSTGHRHLLNGCEILEVDLVDNVNLTKALKGRKFDGVIHFAAKSLVGESILKPDIYYLNNVVGTMNLINEMIKNGNNNLVFSSSAAIFGNPSTEKIGEDDLKKPINPYGQSKLMVENILYDICSAFDFNATCFRYFNAAGADKSGLIGEDHNPETHLIPNILKSTLQNNSNLNVYGNDYSTPDGTCIRDYLHVNDLSNAHLLGLNQMNNIKGFSSYNLGNGNGFSVLEVIKSCERVTGSTIKYNVGPRRVGDPATLVSDSKKAIKNLDWKPAYTELDLIIESAWKWHRKTR